jgi:hypothetical protein
MTASGLRMLRTLRYSGGEISKAMTFVSDIRHYTKMIFLAYPSIPGGSSMPWQLHSVRRVSELDDSQDCDQDQQWGFPWQE